MPSNAHRRWLTVRGPFLYIYEREYWAAAHSQPPDTLAEAALERAYLVMLSSQFQGFCRDLYSECLTALVRAVPASLQLILQSQGDARCELAGGNAKYESIRADFERFDIKLTPALTAHDPLAAAYITDLNQLNQWRNYVAHQGQTPPAHGGPLSITAISQWRVACLGMANALDAVMYDHLLKRLGMLPW